MNAAATTSIPADVAERLSQLAETFPSLRGAPGVRPFDPGTLADWEAPTSGADVAADFVLWLCPTDYFDDEETRNDLRCFDILDAAVMSAPDRAALAAWIVAPWWPAARLEERREELRAQAQEHERRSAELAATFAVAGVH